MGGDNNSAFKNEQSSLEDLENKRTRLRKNSNNHARPPKKKVLEEANNSKLREIEIRVENCSLLCQKKLAEQQPADLPEPTPIEGRQDEGGSGSCDANVRAEIVDESCFHSKRVISNDVAEISDKCLQQSMQTEEVLTTTDTTIREEVVQAACCVVDNGEGDSVEVSDNNSCNPERRISEVEREEDCVLVLDQTVKRETPGEPQEKDCTGNDNQLSLN